MVTLLSDMGDARTEGALRGVRILRLLKLLRILRAGRIIRRWEARIGLSNAVLQICVFALLMSLVAHWGACLIYLSAAMVADDETVTW